MDTRSFSITLSEKTFSTVKRVEFEKYFVGITTAIIGRKYQRFKPITADTYKWYVINLSLSSNPTLTFHFLLSLVSRIIYLENPNLEDQFQVYLQLGFLIRGNVGTGCINWQIKSLEKVCRPIGGLFSSTVSTPLNLLGLSILYISWSIRTTYCQVPSRF